ncbi:MAG: DUF3575 domain-containing protein [Cyclobacteriaceae bacterium]|jgi:hypothetical protein|nr:DUF3575 domain-containing protein [Cyclobacteriaceae bacterium]
MKAIFKFLFCLFIFLVSLSMPAQAQKGDTTARRSTLKVDITSYWLYRDALMFSYERVVKNRPNHTWAITAGLQEFPELVGELVDTITVKQENKSLGYKVGGEYRFYLKKENKHAAPHGVYIGPYTSYHYYSNNRAIEVNNSGEIQNGNLESTLTILNIGVQLGYQFVLNNRWTIDLVFVGPSVSNYAFKADLTGNISVDPDDITNEVLLSLIDKYPGFKDLISEGEYAEQGKVNTWAYGYRYQFQIGYHFGRKKK